MLHSPSRQIDRPIYDAHQAWLKAGRKGPGRLIAEDKSLLGIVATAQCLDGAQFRRCAMKKSDLNNSSFESVLFLRCDLSASNLYMVTFESATLKECVLTNSRLSLAKIFDSTVMESDFSGVIAARLYVKDSTVECSMFQGAMLVDAHFEESRFFECGFRDTKFGRKTPSPCLGITYSSSFENCDFRGADFSGRRVKDCTFKSCRFHGATGIPELGDGVVIENADLSPDGDGSEIVDAATFLDCWRRGDLCTSR